MKVIETPELQRYLDDTLAGLREDLQQVRNDAEEAQQEITELRPEFAPQADTLNDYLVALQQILGVTGELEDAQSNAPPQQAPPQQNRAAVRPQGGK